MGFTTFQKTVIALWFFGVAAFLFVFVLKPIITPIQKGEVWYFTNETNPFEEPDTTKILIIDVKDGWVKYAPIYDTNTVWYTYAKRKTYITRNYEKLK